MSAARAALTDRQREILALIRAHEGLWGVGPTPKVLARRFGVVPQTIEDHALRLYSKGYLASPVAPYTAAAPAAPDLQTR